MSLERWFNNLEARVFGCLCPDDPRTSARDTVWRIDDLLTERRKALNACRRMIQEVGSQVREAEGRIHLLSCKARLCLITGEREAAWHHSMQLEELRSELETDRSRLAHLHQARRNHEGVLNQLTRRLALLQEQSA